MKGNDEGEGNHFCSPDRCTGIGNGGMGSMRVSRAKEPARKGYWMGRWRDGWMDRSEEERRENASVAPLDS